MCGIALGGAFPTNAAAETVDCVTAADRWVDRAIRDGSGGTSSQERHILSVCAAESADRLAQAYAEGGPARSVALHELPRVSPGKAADTFVAALDGFEEMDLPPLRNAISRLGREPRGRDALGAWLLSPKFEALSPKAQLQLLRALEPVLAQMAGAQAAFDEVKRSPAELSFDDAYFTLKIAAPLARSGHNSAVAFIRDYLDPTHPEELRAFAAECAASVDPLRPDLMAMLESTSPRTRAAAASSLTLVSAQPAVRESLRRKAASDGWPMVRRSALAALKGDEPALRAALADASPVVREAAAEQVATEKVVSLLGVLRERAKSAREIVAVRAAAFRALGRLCDEQLVAEARSIVERAEAGSSGDAQLVAAVLPLLALSDRAFLNERARRSPALARTASLVLEQSDAQCSSPKLRH